MIITKPAPATIDLPSWTFHPAHLGCLAADPGTIEFKPLTVVCGPNNSGKTWVLYALYAFLSGFDFSDLPGIDDLSQDLAQKGKVTLDLNVWLKKSGPDIITYLNGITATNLPSTFGGTPDQFTNSRFDWQVNFQALAHSAIERSLDFRIELGAERNLALHVSKPAQSKKILFLQHAKDYPETRRVLANALARHLIGIPEKRRVFLIPSERTGLHLLHREVTNRRANLWPALAGAAAGAGKNGLTGAVVGGALGAALGSLINDISSADGRYARPIADYIDWLNNLHVFNTAQPSTLTAAADGVQIIANGRYAINPQGSVDFLPQTIDGDQEESSTRLKLHLTSSTAKSVMGLWAYLNFQAQPGDVLMIDEPELNLHPSNQRRLARLLAKLVNSGLRVVVSTHSDYLVREINSLLMLSRPAPVQQALMEKYGYSQDELITPAQVSAWLFCDRRIQPMDIDDVEGIAAKTFDDQIHELNDTSDGIYYAYQDALGDHEREGNA